MSVRISFIQRKPIRERAWKTVSVVVGISTILNVSMIGSLIQPQAATAAEVSELGDVAAAQANTNTVPPVQGNNPALGQSCGLDIALVVDTSGSVIKSEMSDMKTALKSFAGAFTGTPTAFSLAQFNTDSSVIQPFTSDISLIQNKIDSALPAAGANNTNWDSGLARANSTFDPRPTKANLIVIATDGSPNRYSYPTATPSTNPLDWNGGLSHAVDRANTIKASGTRIVALGIGSDETDPWVIAHGNADAKLQAISGSTMATTPAAITPATDVIKVTDFTGIGVALASYAKQLCGGKILVQKQFDTNGDGVADVDGSSANALLAGWNFDVNGTASNPAAQVTTSTGALQFNNILNGSDYSVVETQSAGTKLVSAVCKNGTKTVGTLNTATKTVSGLTMGTDETISCTFVNAPAVGALKVTKVVTDGSAKPEQFGFRTGTTGSYTRPAANQNSVTFSNITAGSYTVSENPADLSSLKYHQTASTCSNVTVVAGQTAECTITNARDAGQITFVKVVNNEQGADLSKFTFNVNNATYHSGNSASFPAGTYAMNEVSPDGYSFVSATGACSGTTAANLTLTVGSSATTCTITNTRDMGDVKIVKNVVGGGAQPSDWSFKANGGTAHVSGASFTLPTADYTVTEQGPAGYTLTGASGICSMTAHGIVMHVGKAGGVCTVTNTRDTGKIAFVKVVDNEPKADLSKFDFVLSGHAYHSGDSASINVGQYALVENAPSNYVFVSATGACAGTKANSIMLTSTAQGGTCTITNHLLNPDLTVTKTDGVTTATPGQTLTYSIVVANVGDTTAKDAAAVDTLPAHTTYVSSAVDGVNATPVVSGTKLTWNLGDMSVAGPTSMHTITVKVKLDALFPNGSTTLTNSVTVATTSTEKSLANNTATDTDTVTAAPTITLTKTAPASVPAGQNIVYTINWSIGGSTPVTNAVVSDTVPANTSFISSTCGTTTGTCTIAANAAGTTWNLGNRNPGDTGTVTMVVKSASPVASGTIVTNTASFKTTENAQVLSTVTTKLTSGSSLVITKTNDVVGYTNPGKQVNYTVTVTNTTAATDAAHAVVLTDVLPAGFTYTIGGGSSKNFNLGEIAPGASVVTTYAATISATQAAGVYTNTATAGGPNNAPVSATSNVEVRIPTILGVTLKPEITITKSVDTKVTTPGKVITYTVTISNTGDTDLTEVSVNDKLPKGFTFVDGGQATKSWTIGTLKANRQRVINYQVTVSASQKSGNYQNLATVVSKELDPKTAKVSVEVRAPKVLGLATTGVSSRDYLFFAFGLGVMSLGIAWIGRLRRESTDQPLDGITYA